MKRLAYFITTILTFGGFSLAVAVLPAFAADSVGGQNVVNEVNHQQNKPADGHHFDQKTGPNQASHSANKSATELPNIISHANTLIMTRLDSLNTLLTRVNNDTRLTASEKSSLTSDIQKDISGLTALKAKIDADTAATTARADIKTIITNYYVYAVFEPKVRLLVTLNNLETTAGYVQALIPQLQNLINTLKTQGKDTSQIQPLLDDISSQVKTINTTLLADITTVQNISTTTKRNSSDFSKVRQDISQIVRERFAKIRSDFAKMRPLFKQLIGTTQLTPPVAPSGIQPTTATTETPSTSPSPTQ
jgi:archaellum component FlaC